MICVRIRITGASGSRLVRIAAGSIRGAVELAALLNPGCATEVVFPIDAETFFDARGKFAEAESRPEEVVR